MEVINSIQNRRSKKLKPNLDHLAADMVKDEDISLGSDEPKLAAASLLETEIEASEPFSDSYEFRDEAGISPLDSDDLPLVEDSAEQSSDSQPVQAYYANPVNGGIYVLGSTQEMFPLSGTQKTLKNDRPSARDDKRRATHNEVERRRRDKINYWIMKLGKIIPDCKQDSNKSLESTSKGGILAKACDYITELRESNQKLLILVKENEQLLSDIETMTQQNNQLKMENARLINLFKQHNISVNQ